MKPLPKIGLSRVWVRAGIDEPVTVGWSTTEISGRVLRKCRHRGTDAHLDSSALSLAHATEQSHHQVVCLGAGINRSADLGYPQADAVVREDREGERELRPVERTGGFPDHYSIKATVPTSDISKET
ncbi:hypothetical protein AWB93_02105 [Mycobacterium bohemicum]|uniref:Uncharacterized protein n=1 Tax=Mycobacterium bohemicum TaxID=56425 RepID=A0A1X1RDT9_MYCBE|nr:hypothetical protein AWB93_02105 [Mycobacterium bohemicum]